MRAQGCVRCKTEPTIELLVGLGELLIVLLETIPPLGVGVA